MAKIQGQILSRQFLSRLLHGTDMVKVFKLCRRIAATGVFEKLLHSQSLLTATVWLGPSRTRGQFQICSGQIGLEIGQ